MTKSRLISLSDKLPVLIRHRPLCIVALFVVFITVYRNSKGFETTIIPESHTERYGTVASKSDDENGCIKSFSLEGENKYLCYLSESVPDFDVPAIGSKVYVSGRLSMFRKATNPGQFDSLAYYESLEYDGCITVSSIRLAHKPFWRLPEYLYRLKKRFVQAVREHCPLEYGTINTLLFADKTNLNPERKSLFMQTGLSHFLVVSGLHISILGGIISSLVKRTKLRPFPRAAISSIFVILYGALTGFGISVIRAVVMYLIKQCAALTKRTYDSLSALSFITIIELSLHPSYIHNSGFVYSYAATLCISIFYSALSKQNNTLIMDDTVALSFWEKGKRSLRNNMLLPIFLYICLLPVNLWFSYTSFVGSSILNLILGLLTMPTLICSLSAFIFAFIGFNFPAGLFDFFTALLLRFMDLLCKLFSGIDILTVKGKPTFNRIVCFYILFALILIVAPRFMNRIAKLASILVILTVLTTPFGFTAVFTMLDVGQGECMVLQYAPQKAIIIDMGSASMSKLPENIIYPFLNYSGIYDITDLFLSHADSDHTNGVCDFLSRQKENCVSVRRIFTNSVKANIEDENMRKIAEKGKDTDIPVYCLKTGDTIRKKTLHIQCLWPDMNTEIDNCNDSSLVVMLTCGNYRFLLLGDVSSEAEESILNTGINSFVSSYDYTKVLKVPHHGSKYSASKMLTEAFNPDICFISAGKNNSYGHPHKETLDMYNSLGLRYYITASDGAIRISLSQR